MASSLRQSSTKSEKLTVSMYFYLHLKYTGTWPTSREKVEKAVRTGYTVDQLIIDLKKNRPRGAATMPAWARSALAPELGQYAAYLVHPELQNILVTAAALGYDAAKTDAAIQTTSWWQNTTARQRQWDLLSQAEKAERVATWKVWVMQTIEASYGPDATRSRGYSLSSDIVARYAEELASARQTPEAFTYAMQKAAEGVSGTPSFTARTEEFRRAGEAEVTIENTAMRLEEIWRDWLGPAVTLPTNLKDWANNIYMNRASEADFQTYLREVSKQLYPRKPDFISYADWVEPAKRLVEQTLDLGRVEDNDPLVLSYVNGEVPSLYELQIKARRDARHQRTSAGVAKGFDIAQGIARAFGFQR